MSTWLLCLSVYLSLYLCLALALGVARLFGVSQAWAPVIAWYDLWAGCYWDRDRARLYILPIPCVGVSVSFPSLAVDRARDRLAPEEREQLKESVRSLCNLLDESLPLQVFEVDSSDAAPASSEFGTKVYLPGAALAKGIREQNAASMFSAEDIVRGHRRLGKAVISLSPPSATPVPEIGPSPESLGRVRPVGYLSGLMLGQVESPAACPLWCLCFEQKDGSWRSGSTALFQRPEDALSHRTYIVERDRPSSPTLAAQWMELRACPVILSPEGEVLYGEPYDEQVKP